MKIKFAHPAISEFAEGNFHVKNDGKAFETEALFGAELLHKRHWLGEAEGFVNVFEEVKAADVAETAGNTHTAESLAKMSRKELAAIATDAGLDGDRYTNKQELAAAILTALTKGE